MLLDWKIRHALDSACSTLLCLARLSRSILFWSCSVLRTSSLFCIVRIYLCVVCAPPSLSFFPVVMRYPQAEIQKSLELVIATQVNATAGDQSVRKKRASLLQHVLAVSHRYQALRLQLWCEDQLCHNISVTEVY